MFKDKALTLSLFCLYKQRVFDSEWQWQVTASGAKVKYMLKDR